MNKGMYRLVFNRARGELMAVAEFVVGQRGGSTPRPPASRQQSAVISLRPLAFSLLCALNCVWIVPAHGHSQIIADPNAPRQQQAQILPAGNNPAIPVINIQTPNGQGVSHNTYSRFDVGPDGAVLNNARTHQDSRSQLAGYVGANPNLVGGSARLILNEVNARDPSQLRGYLDVAGQKAQVVVANPAGITCDGCGFINAHRATLTTGTPQFDGSGSLTGYRVDSGSIVVGGSGMDASRVDQTDILARAVEVNAGLWASELTVTTGANLVSAGNGAQAERRAASGDTPQFALDVSALGGMYAGKITMTGTEKGVGVRVAGYMGAAVGEAVITADGRLENSGRIGAAQRLILSADGIDNRSGGEIAAGHTDITATTLTNRGRIDGSQTQLRATTLNNAGTGKIYGDSLQINAGTLNNREEDGSSAVIAARESLLIGAGQIDNREHSLIYSGGDMAIGGNVDSSGQLTGSAARVDNTGATLESAGSMQLSVATLNNRNPDFATHIVETDRRQINEYSFYPDRDGGPIYGSGEVYVDGASSDGLNTLHTPDGRGDDHYYQYDYLRVVTEEQILRSDPGRILSGGDMLINAERVLNDKSEIVAGGALIADVAELVNTERKGERIRTDSGILHEFYRKKRKGRDDQGHNVSLYAPAPVITEIDLQPTTWLGNTLPTGSGLSTDQDFILSADNGLLQQVTDPTARYYLETDPRFTDYRSWLSSDTMLALLATDPGSLHKRLGDGFTEQRMIREQVVKLTGQRFLDSHSSDEAQYRALIDSGVAFAREHSLIPGIALTAGQMAALTSSMVWLVEQQATLPDGSTVTALVPKVYIAADGTRQAPSAALIAGRSVGLALSGELTSSGTLSAAESLSVDADAITHRGGNIRANDLRLRATGDINHTGGLIAGDNSLALLAGGNINVESQRIRTEGAQGYVENISRVADIRVKGTGQTGELTLKAGGDISLTAAAISNRAENGSTRLSADNIRLNTVTGSFAQNNQFDGNNWLNRSGSSETGTVIRAQGDITLEAARDIHARAASLTSDGGDLAVSAGNDITLASGRRTDSTDAAHKSSGKSGGGNSVSLMLRDRVDRDSAIASQLSAENIILSAGRDITVAGSDVVATHDTGMTAGRDVTLRAAQESYSNSHYRQETKSGAFASGASVTFGRQSQTLDSSASGTESFASTLGSLEGNISVNAGGSYRQTGSHVNALEGDTGIAAGEIALDASADAWQQRSLYSFEQKGLTLGVSNPLISAIQTAQGMHQASRKTDDPRMQALAGATTGLAAYNAASAVAQSPQTAGGINLSVTWGQSRSQELTDTRGISQTGSTLQAGGNVLLNADTREGRSGSGNISVTGSDITAGNALGLSAENDILLTAAGNTRSQQRDSRSSSSGAGVGLTVGSGISAGLSVSGSAGRGEAEGDDLWHSASHLTAGDTLSLHSGGDTTLSGATAKGHTLTAGVGKNLTIASLQDTGSYKSKDRNAGGSVTVGNGFSASAHYGQNNVRADFASVTEQSGLFAGDGGFNISVGGHTGLTGAAIASTDKAVRDGRNQLSTGTLASRDIENRSGYDASGFSFGAGYSKPTGQKAGGGSAGGVSKDPDGNATTGAGGIPGTEQPGYKGWSATTPVALSARDDVSSTTRSGISGGDITVRDEAGQQAQTGQTTAETLASLNRDVSSDRDGSNAIDNLYERDREKIDAGFEITRAFQNEVSTFAVAKAKKADDLKKELDARGIDPTTSAEYQDALKWAPGGQYSQIITAITAATGSNVMGGFDQLAQAAVLNYVQGLGAQHIKKLADSIGKDTPEGEAARAVLQGLAACGAQAGQGGNCASAGLGTAAGVIANAVLNNPQAMTSEEKKAREDLITTLVAGAAAAAGGDAGSAVAGVQVEQENNSLSLVVQGGKLAVQGCTKVAACRNALLEKGLGALLGIGIAETALDNLSTSEQQYVLGVAISGRVDLIDALTPEQRAAYEYIVEQDKKGLFSLLAVQQSSTDESSSKPNVGKELTDAERVEFGGVGSGTPGGWEPQDEKNAGHKNNAKFDTAKERYPKQYEQYSKLPDKNLEKAISKHNKKIAEHQGYLDDLIKRKQHVPNWDKLSSQHQENLLHHWQQDIKRHESYKSIAEGILRGRK